MWSKESDDAYVYEWIYLWRTAPRKTHCCFTDRWTRNDWVLNQPMTKDCHNKILAVRCQTEHDKAFKTQIAVSTDISQSLIYKLLCRCSMASVSSYISLQWPHSCVGQNMVCRHVQSQICRCHQLLAGIPKK